MPNADSKNRNTRQMRQTIPVIGLKAFITTRNVNIVPDKTRPMIQANFFCAAPTYSGTWFLTISRPMINVGEYFGLIKTRMMKSRRNTVMTYLTIKKSPLNMMIIKEMNTKRKRIPAEALISRSFKTGILYPSTSSPNFTRVFVFFISCLFIKKWGF